MAKKKVAKRAGGAKRKAAPTRARTAKRAGRASPAPKDAPMRICFERIIPDDLDPERAVRRALREELAASAGARGDARAGRERAIRMAVQLSKKWPTGSTLVCRFLDGTPTMRSRVEGIAHEWEQYANIKFRFADSGSAEIRISFFADAGSWSALGRDALNRSYFPSHQPTMNYGWLRDDTHIDEYSRVVLHEFGHALGCVHEHSSSKFARKWNEQKVMAAYSGPPNYWDAAKIKHNILSKYSPTAVAATDFDPKSIMLYAFSGDLFTDGKGPTNSNKSLSKDDKAMIKKMYPKT